MAEKSFLDRAAEYAYQELDRVGGDPAKLAIPLQTVVVLYTVQAVVDNGGFQYLFEGNSFSVNVPYSVLVSAYRRIGAFEVAEKLEKAVSAFPFPDPHLNQDKRVQFLEELEEQSEFFALGNEVCGDEKVWRDLEDYAKCNAASFPVHIN